MSAEIELVARDFREDLAQNLEAVGLDDFARYVRVGGSVPTHLSAIGSIETNKRLFAAIDVTLNKAAAFAVSE